MATVNRFDPFNELVDDLFKGFLVRPVAYDGRGGEALPRLKVDVAEQNGAYTVTAELPGVRKDDIQVTKGIAEDARVRVQMPRSFFNVMAKEAHVADWREAFTYGQAKATGVQEIIKLIVHVVEKQEERTRTRRARGSA